MSIVIFKWLAKKNLIENIPFESSLAGSSKQAIWISEEQCKGSEVGSCVAYIKYCEEAPMFREVRGK